MHAELANLRMTALGNRGLAERQIIGVMRGVSRR
jgi:hypothetical protein